jgi:hypothetical protein
MKERGFYITSCRGKSDLVTDTTRPCVQTSAVDRTNRSPTNCCLSCCSEGIVEVVADLPKWQSANRTCARNRHCERHATLRREASICLGRGRCRTMDTINDSCPDPVKHHDVHAKLSRVRNGRSTHTQDGFPQVCRLGSGRPCTEHVLRASGSQDFLAFGRNAYSTNGARDRVRVDLSRRNKQVRQIFVWLILHISPQA